MAVEDAALENNAQMSELCEKRIENTGVWGEAGR